jgi:hypothetical protein
MEGNPWWHGPSFFEKHSMTRVSGHTLIASPCCQSIFKTVVYASLNMSAMGYWTDGAQEHGLAATDGGLRLCRCGTAFLLRDAIHLGTEAGPDTEFADKPADAQLPAIFQTAPSPRVEVTARRNYWRYLNDQYREQYRAHREIEDARAHDEWRRDYYASLPLPQRALRKLLRSNPKPDFPRATRPFTVPPFHPTAQQSENMACLLALILAGAEMPFKANALEIAELHRELGNFDAAAQALHTVSEDREEVTKQVIKGQILERSAAPIRYRM